MKLLIFNPEHDLCLANGDKNYVPPSSALQFGAQCSRAMALLSSGAVETCSPFDDNIGSIDWRKYRSITAWGWNSCLVERLKKLKAPERLLPSEATVADIRRLSHRQIAVEASRFINERVGERQCAFLCTTQKEVAELLAEHRHMVLKAPWSGSGRGLHWVADSLTDADCSWISKIIRTQSSVVAEVRRRVVLDFAVEYFIDKEQQQLHTVGYSLFSTQSGIYRSNLLLSDSDIEQKVSGMVGRDCLNRALSLQQEWLRKHVCGCYYGPLGVDMFVYDDTRSPFEGTHNPLQDTHNVALSQSEPAYKLNPLVEINFRYTMGMVARELLVRHPSLIEASMSLSYNSTTKSYNNSTSPSCNRSVNISYNTSPYCAAMHTHDSLQAGYANRPNAPVYDIKLEKADMQTSLFDYLDTHK